MCLNTKIYTLHIKRCHVYVVTYLTLVLLLRLVFRTNMSDQPPANLREAIDRYVALMFAEATWELGASHINPEVDGIRRFIFVRGLEGLINARVAGTVSHGDFQTHRDALFTILHQTLPQFHQMMGRLVNSGQFSWLSDVV